MHRVSVTLTDEMYDEISELSKAKGFSRDRFMSIIIEQWLAKPSSQWFREKHELLSEIRDLKAELESVSEKKHNERGAGRKKQYSEAHKLAMMAYWKNGMSYRQIAKIYDCSPGTVYKLINEQ